MIGNDIVDLKTALRENNWRRNGYLQKIFTKEEQEYISASNQPDTIVWLLWSMKEAAYKIINRATHLRTYAPIKLACSISTLSSIKAIGQVSAYGISYSTSSQISAETIHTVAQSISTKIVTTVILLIVEKGEEYNRKLLTHGYSFLKNKYGLPYVIDINSGHYKYASLSHHGIYTALVVGNNIL